MPLGCRAPHRLRKGHQPCISQVPRQRRGVVPFSMVLRGDLGARSWIMTLTTPLDALHRRLGARMVEFAGYAMPVQYPAAFWLSIWPVVPSPGCSTCRTWAKPQSRDRVPLNS